MRAVRRFIAVHDEIVLLQNLTARFDTRSLIARERLSDFYARTTCSTTASESVLQRAEDSATYAYVLDQDPLGSNLRCSRHRARHDVGGDTMGCLEAGISAAVGPTLV